MTDLSITAIALHELIHKEIFRKLLSISQHPSINLKPNQVIQLRNDYPGLYDYYTRWRWNIPQGQNPSSPQHEAMAQHYRDIIKSALREFDPNQPEEVYDALSWRGLENTADYQELSSSEQSIVLFTQDIVRANYNQNCN